LTKKRSQDKSQEIVRALDTAHLVDVASRLCRVPTDVPAGYQTLMEPDDPKLVHYVQEVVRPELQALDSLDLLDVPRNNLVVQLGRGDSGKSLLIQNYTPAQHHNQHGLAGDPFSGEVKSAAEYGLDGPALFGQGVSQTKGHQAVMLAVLKLLQDRGVALKGRLYWAVNNEGRSSPACSEAIIGALDQRPSFGIIQIGTGLRLSLGNRGRVDIDVHVTGKATHSSAPQDGLSAIEGANQIINRLKELAWPKLHPILGGRHALVYKLRFEPLFPHTLPSDAYLSIDRRLLPGDDPEHATAEVRDIIGDLSPCDVTVERGVYMLPALVDPEHPGVLALQAANQVVRGAPAETYYGQGTFDAGGPCALGVPTVMYGASGGVGLLGPDFVAVSALETEARVLAHLILSELT
jgi:acetylornithine deacetylase/succinyl-diaminopimelate desuccinylase-like protein